MRIYSQEIGMEFALEKSATLIMKSRKWYRTERIELQNQEKIKMCRKMEIYKYLEILKVDTIKHAEMEEKIKKRIP